MISLLYLSFGLRLRSVLEFGFKSKRKCKKKNHFTQVLFCKPNKSNSEIGRSHMCVGVVLVGCDVVSWVSDSQYSELSWRFYLRHKICVTALRNVGIHPSKDTASYPRTLECPQYIPFIACCKN